MNFKSLAILAVFSGLATAPLAQSFNVSCEGRDLPSIGFGAAANQPGYWNPVAMNPWGYHIANATYTKRRLIFDLAGNPTLISYLTSANSLGWVNPSINGTSGDYAALFCDALGAEDATFKFNNLEPGTYTVYTYAVDNGGDPANASVEVLGSTSPIQTVTGPLMGNTFQHLRTHSIHEVTTTGLITIRVIGLDGPYFSVCGFQFIKH